MRYTPTTLKKLESLFEELEYTVRYEKGSFQSGYCLVEQRKIAVINRFYDTEARINCLLDILMRLEIDSDQLSETGRDVLQKSRKMFSENQENTEESPEPATPTENPQP